jgi:hypothetical protein
MGFLEPSSGLPHYCSALTQNPIRHSRRGLAHSILRFSVHLSYSSAQASFSCCYDMPPHRLNSQSSSRSSNPGAKDFRLLLIDLLHLAMVVVAVFAIFVFSQILPQFFNSAIAQTVSFLMRVALALAVFTFAGVFIFFILFGMVFLLIRVKELRDRSRFDNAEELTTIDNSRVYAREEGGTNTY